ncbi:hypothetical protein PS017_24570, partial [Shigella sonnei]|nr:hypothetical protein [Shigella sonnei]
VSMILVLRSGGWSPSGWVAIPALAYLQPQRLSVQRLVYKDLMKAYILCEITNKLIDIHCNS